MLCTRGLVQVPANSDCSRQHNNLSHKLGYGLSSSIHRVYTCVRVCVTARNEGCFLNSTLLSPWFLSATGRKTWCTLFFFFYIASARGTYDDTSRGQLRALLQSSFFGTAVQCVQSCVTGRKGEILSPPFLDRSCTVNFFVLPSPEHGPGLPRNFRRGKWSQ